MKRLCIQTFVLCAMLMVITVTASADGGTVSKLEIQDDNVSVQPLTDAGESITATDGAYQGARKFQITLGQAQQGAWYLAMIRIGDGVPTKNNLYWCDAILGSDGKAVFKANPRLMGSGSYDIWTTSDADGGDVKRIGSFDYGSSILIGDATLDGSVDIKDVVAVIGHITKNKLLTGEALQAADVVKDEDVDIKDASKLIGYVTKNVKSLTD